MSQGRPTQARGAVPPPVRARSGMRIPRGPTVPASWQPSHPAQQLPYQQAYHQQPAYHQQQYPHHDAQQQQPFNPAYYQDYQQGPYQPAPSQDSRQGMSMGQPMSDAFSQFPQGDMVQQAVLHLAKDHMKGVSWLSMNRFRYYFHVNNTYVLKKLKIILLPYLHKRWSRERNSHEGESNIFLPPSADINAPDLYIPLMAFITYILMMGFIVGVSKAFTPEVLGSTATWALAILIIEVILLRVGFAIVASSASVVAPPLLDLVAYSSYKFVILVIDLAVWVLSSHNSTMYWVISITTGISMTIFMARTLQRAFVPRVENGSYGVDDTNKSTRQLFLIAVGFCQIPTCFILGRSIAI